MEMKDEGQEDIFGFPKMSTNMEIAISYVLFVLGVLMVLSVVYPVRQFISINAVYVGLLMVGVAYVFAMESVRELEEKDHFLSRKLMNRMEDDEE
jgi:hypothetical protein